MPITGTPVTPQIVTVDNVRLFLRDKLENNVLLDTVQFTQAEVDYAVRLSLSAFNAMTPISYYDSTSFPNEYILMLGAVKYLMMSQSFLEVRNEVSYPQEGTGAIGIDQKTTQYSGLYNMIRGEWTELARNLKNQLNSESCYGALGSGYRFIRGE